MPQQAHEMLREELEKCRSQIKTFEKNYIKKRSA
jgi:5-bromo-4-chloroindolyl phosphate hydrolysis protein